MADLTKVNDPELVAAWIRYSAAVQQSALDSQTLLGVFNTMQACQIPPELREAILSMAQTFQAVLANAYAFKFAMERALMESEPVQSQHVN